MPLQVRYLQENPGAELDGRPLVQVVVEQAVQLALSNDYLWRNGTFDPLIHSLERDGFVIEDGQLRAALPSNLDLPAADDEVHLLLNRHNLPTPLGHLNQAITAHGRGDWAAANSQIRSVFESLLDEVAYLLVPNAPRGQNQGEARREALSNLQPPFLSLDLNEWGNQGKNLVNGIFKRLHPQGAHPGLSDEEDSTFRLHLVLLAARLFLRRLDALL